MNVNILSSLARSAENNSEFVTAKPPTSQTDDVTFT